jgi:antitoxin VapB
VPREVSVAPSIPETQERRAKLFRVGRNQTATIPREFELPGNDAIIRRKGRCLVIEAAPPCSLLAVLATLRPLAEDFSPIEELPHGAVDF